MRWTVGAIDRVAAFATVGAVAVGGVVALDAWATWPSPAPAPARAWVTAAPSEDVPSATPSPTSSFTVTPGTPHSSTRAGTRGRPQPRPGDAPSPGRPPAPAPSAPAPAPAVVPAPPATPAPSPWLEGPAVTELRERAESVPTAAVDVTLASFNVLGSSHTARGGKLPHWAAGATRVVAAAAALRAHEVEIVGLQELQPDQVQAISRALDGWGIFPGASMTWREGENSVMWERTSWDAVETHTVAIPYFDGETRRMPYVRLRHRTTGAEVWVANFHNPADTGRFGRQDRWRAEATRRQVALAQQLRRTGLPVFFTGDFNDRERYFCALTGSTDLRSSTGGSASPTSCSPPPRMQIDWIFGSTDVSWLDSTVDPGPMSRRVTDHPLVVATARLGVG